MVGITWPVPSELHCSALECKLFTPPGAIGAEKVRPQPDWARIHAELWRAGVTLLLLSEEYRDGQPDGYGYSPFCDLYTAWRGCLSPAMRQNHPLGERSFVEYAGQMVEIVDALTGEGPHSQATQHTSLYQSVIGSIHPSILITLDMRLLSKVQ